MVYLGADLHRKVSHVVAMDVGGDVVLSRRISTDPGGLLLQADGDVGRCAWTSL